VAIASLAKGELLADLAEVRRLAACPVADGIASTSCHIERDRIRDRDVIDV
jgi:hypothetical protein